MYTDPISDYLTRIRNAQTARHRVVEIPASNMKQKMTEILYEKGYILKYKFEDSDNKQGVIKIALKYDQASNIPAIRKMEKISKPGLRVYKNANELPRIINGLGIAIISTSKGLMTDKEARAAGIGGEVVCSIY
jgi:small subunit ribosomal protein S8